MSCITCSFGIMVSLFQILGVVQTVAWPGTAGMRNFLGFFQLFVLDVDGYGFSCLASGPVQQFASKCIAFFAVVFGLVLMAFLTNLLFPRCLSWLAWGKYKTMGTICQFCQVSFTTMTNVGLAPFMCYRHPAGSESVTKYSGVFCQSNEHMLMQLLGISVLSLSSVFLASCFFFAWKAPAWSGQAIQGGIRFLILRFRPNVWWFGLVLLLRSPLLSMPAVVAPNMPAVQFVWRLGTVLLSLQLQVWYLPWKAPILNLVDAVASSLLVMLLAIGLGRLGTDPDGGPAVLDNLAAAVSAIMMFTCTCVIGLLLLVAFAARFCKKAFTSSQALRVMNLGCVPSSEEVCDNLTNLLYRQRELHENDMKQVLDVLCVYDYCDVNASVVLLSMELGLSSRTTDALAMRRITLAGSTAFMAAGSNPTPMNAIGKGADGVAASYESRLDDATDPRESRGEELVSF